MSYRPITDVWILARSKVKYYGAYPAGFLHRARALLGVSPDDAILHVCGGKVRDYPYRGLGPNDRTLDLDPACQPNFLQDARDALPRRACTCVGYACHEPHLWDAVLIDRPYTPEDAVLDSSKVLWEWFLLGIGLVCLIISGLIRGRPVWKSLW